MRFNFNSLNLSCCGGNRFIFNLSNAIVERGHKVSITHVGLKEYSSWFKPIKADVRECGFSVFERGLARARGHKIGLREQLLRLKEVQVDCDFNVATYCMTAYPTYESGKGCPVYLVQHFEPLFFVGNRELSFMSEATYSLPLKKLCVSQWLADKVEGVNIGNGLDLNKFKVLPKIKNNRPVVLGLSVKDDFKRPELLADVLRHCERFADVIVPNGVSDGELVKLYNGADCFVGTSSKEGFYYPALEAMAAGCPVVSSACAEYLRDGVNCLVPESDDVLDFVFAVKRVLYDSELRLRLIRGGLETAREYSFDKVVDNFLHVCGI